MKTSAACSVIECLESKIAPAGTVTAVFAGGVLTLTGGIEDNAITITETAPDRFTIAGTAGTLIQFGADPAAASVSIIEAVLSIKTDLKEGNDSVTLVNVDLTKDLTVNQGLGNNTTLFNNLSLGGNVTVQGGSGSDTVTISTRFLVGGKATFTLGDGTNSVQVNAITLAVHGAFAYTGGNAADTLAMTGASLFSLGSLTVNAGSGAGTISLLAGDDLQINGAVAITTADHVGVAVDTSFNVDHHLFIAGAVTIKNGLGENNVEINGASSLHVIGAVSVINAGAEGETAITSDHTSLDGGVTLKRGNGTSGTNRLYGAFLEVIGSVSMTLGNLSGSGLNAVGGNNVEVSGGITLVSGNGTFINNIFAPLLNVGGIIAIKTLDSTSGVTENTISSLGTLNAQGISITTGDGRFINDIISTASGGRIAGNVTVTNGDSMGASLFTGLILPQVTGSITVKNGQGDYTTQFYGPAMAVGGSVTVSNGTPATAGGTTTLFNATNVNIDGSVTVNNAGGSVITRFTNTVLDVKGGLTINNGHTGNPLATTNIFTIAETMRVGGAFSIKNGDGVFTTTMNLGMTVIGGSMLVQSGSQSTGNTQLTVDGTGNFQVNGGLTVKALGGNTLTNISALNIFIKGALSVSGGDLTDNFAIVSGVMFQAGSVSTALGQGSSAITLASGNTDIKGALSLSSLSGDDDIFLNGPGRIGGNFTINTGGGPTSSITVDGSSGRGLEVVGATLIKTPGTVTSSTLSVLRTTFHGGLTYTGGDTVDTLNLTNSISRGLVTVNTGLGNDSLNINDCTFFGAVNAQTGAGMDTVRIENDSALLGRTLFFKASTISTGDDADSFVIAAPTDAARTLELRAALTLHAGFGLDTISEGANILGIPLVKVFIP